MSIERYLDYLEKEISVKAKGKKGWTLEDIVKVIEWCYRNNGHISISITGNKGAGKTTLALLIASRVYNNSWKKALNQLYFDAREAIEYLIDTVRHGRRVKLIVMDDAGMWLPRRRRTRDVEYFIEFLHIIRTATASILYTFPEGDVSRYIWNSSQIRIMVYPLSREEKLSLSLNPDEMWARGRIYRVRMTPMRQFYPKVIGEIIYKVYIPDSIYREYEEIRRQYVIRRGQQLIERLWEE